MNVTNIRNRLYISVLIVTTALTYKYGVRNLSVPSI
jgi:hypothetical protein